MRSSFQYIPTFRRCSTPCEEALPNTRFGAVLTQTSASLETIGSLKLVLGMG